MSSLRSSFALKFSSPLKDQSAALIYLSKTMSFERLHIRVSMPRRDSCGAQDNPRSFILRIHQSSRCMCNDCCGLARDDPSGSASSCNVTDYS